MNNLINEEELLSWYTHLHENPEVTFQEFQTTEYIKNILATFGHLEILTPAPTGVVAVLHGLHKGKTIALRADIDALPMQEIQPEGALCSKVDNVAHICGHDTHTAMLLEACRILVAHRHLLHGTVKFIFQAAEEQFPGGANTLCQSGVLDDVEAFFGIHIAPGFPTGHIYMVKEGSATTASDTFKVTIHGKGTHGSMPHLGIDPIIIGSQIVQQIQSIISSHCNPLEPAVVSFGQFKAGHAPNIIPDEAYLEGTIRTTNAQTRLQIERLFKDMVNYTCKMHGAWATIDYENGYPSLINNPELTKNIYQLLQRKLGEDQVHYGSLSMASEDFSYYSLKAPSCFMNLGAGLKEDGYIYANHNPHFKIDCAALKTGVLAHLEIALKMLGEE